MISFHFSPSCAPFLSLPSILMFHFFIVILQFLPLISWLEMIAEILQTLAGAWGTQFRLCSSWLPQACYFRFPSLVPWFCLSGGYRTHFMTFASRFPTSGLPPEGLLPPALSPPSVSFSDVKAMASFLAVTHGWRTIGLCLIWCTDIILNLLLTEMRKLGHS